MRCAVSVLLLLGHAFVLTHPIRHNTIHYPPSPPLPPPALSLAITILTTIAFFTQVYAMERVEDQKRAQKEKSELMAEKKALGEAKKKMEEENKRIRRELQASCLTKQQAEIVDSKKVMLQNRVPARFEL